MQRWSIVCSNDVLFKSISQSLFFVGHFFGALIAGYLADRFGRKRAFVVLLFPNIGFALASHFVDHPYGWMAIRFFMGVCNMACNTIKAVYTVSKKVVGFIIMYLCTNFHFRKALGVIFQVTKVCNYFQVKKPKNFFSGI